MGKRFLAIGECMAELAPAERAGEFRLGFAGDTFNTAWYMAQISEHTHVSYLTAIGDDAISEDMRAFITASGVDVAHIRTIPGKSVGAYLIHLENGERRFSYWRDTSAARDLASDAVALSSAMEEADLIYFSGITLAILDRTSRETLLKALEQARASGKRVAFDTNLRPRLWADTEEMKSAVMRAAALCDLVLPSFEDEATWFGDLDSHATLERYAEIGVPCIVVKNGSGPVVFQLRDQRGEIEVDTADRVIDTTAAGDSFNAGTLAGILAGRDIETAIRAGCLLAGQVVQQRGALVPVSVGTGTDG